MVYRLLLTPALVGFLITLAGCEARPDPTPGPAAPGPAAPEPAPSLTGSIVFGRVNTQVSDQTKKWYPLTDHLAAHLGEFGIGRGEVKLAPDMVTMVHWLESGEVDFYLDSFYPATSVGRRAGIPPSLLRHKTPSEISAVFFTRADRGVESLADLEGRVIALDERASTTGFMLPVTHLIRAGFKPVEKPHPDAAVAADEIGYVFSTGDRDTIQWVISRRVMAGAVDDVTFAQALERGARELVVLDETERFYRNSPVLFRPDMDQDLLAAVRSLLLRLQETEEGRAVLDHTKTVRFSEISPEDEIRLSRQLELYELLHPRSQSGEPDADSRRSAVQPR